MMRHTVETLIHIVGIISPFTLPLLLIVLQPEWVAGAAFILVGVVTGALLRTWWAIIYILGLGICLLLFGLLFYVAHSDMRFVSGEIFLAVLTVTLPSTAVGVWIGRGIESRIRHSQRVELGGS